MTSTTSKAVNDTHGHLAGDRVLLTVADRIRRRVAVGDVEVPAPGGAHTISGLSVSIGGALHPAQGADPTALPIVADAELYEAKRGGRDTVHVSHRGDPELLR